MFKIVGQHVAPPAGVPSPLAWGTDDRLQQLLGSGADVDITRRQFTFRFRSAAHYFETFRDFYGPMLRAWEALDEPGRASLRSELEALATDAGRANGGGIAIASEYLEVVATRR